MDILSMILSRNQGGNSGGLPVVELSTIATTEGSELNADEMALINSAAQRNLPFVLKCRFDAGGAVMNVVATAIILGMADVPDLISIVATFSGNTIGITGTSESMNINVSLNAG